MSITKSLQAWHQSMQLVSQIYHLFPSRSEVSYNLQFRQSANAIGQSIAEALGKNTHKHYVYHFSQANAMINELKAQLKSAATTDNLHVTDYLILVNSATIVQETLVEALTKITQQKNNT
jgi:four helix bundle protein